MSKSSRLIQNIALLPSVLNRRGVAELPQRAVRRNTKFAPDLVETASVVRHRLSLDSFKRKSTHNRKKGLKILNQAATLSASYPF